MEKIQLTTNMRVRTDTTLSEFLLCIGNGKETTIKENLIALPQQMIVLQIQDGNPEESLVREIFLAIEQNYRSVEYVRERPILASQNELVDNLNEMKIGKFPGETKTYINFDIAEDDTNNYNEEKYLNTLKPNGLLSHKYIVKYIKCYTYVLLLCSLITQTKKNFTVTNTK